MGIRALIGLARTLLERPSDHLDHRAKLAEDQVIREPKHPDTVAKEERCALLVVLQRSTLEVLSSIELYSEPPSRTVEVQDVRPDGVLPPELES